MINAYFDEREEILYVHIDGETSLEELTRMARAILENPTLPRTLKVLELANAEMERIHLPDMKKLISDHAESIRSKFVSIRHAVVSNNPAIVAYTIMVKGNLANGIYCIDVFSTEDAAKTWLMHG